MKNLALCFGIKSSCSTKQNVEDKVKHIQNTILWFIDKYLCQNVHIDVDFTILHPSVKYQFWTVVTTVFH